MSAEQRTSNIQLDQLIDSLRHRPVATTAAQMREAADLIEGLQHALDARVEDHEELIQDLKGLNEFRPVTGTVEWVAIRVAALSKVLGSSSGEPVSKSYGKDEAGSCPKCGHRSI